MQPLSCLDGTELGVQGPADAAAGLQGSRPVQDKTRIEV